MDDAQLYPQGGAGAQGRLLTLLGEQTGTHSENAEAAGVDAAAPTKTMDVQ